MAKSTTRRTFARLLLLGILFVGLPLGFLALTWLATLPDVGTLVRHNPTSTAHIDSRLTEEGRTVQRQWTWVPLARISSNLQRAVIAAEDASFFIHEGFDWKGIQNAALDNLEAGKMKRGGSTITQQLAKNL